MDAGVTRSNKTQGQKSDAQPDDKNRLSNTAGKNGTGHGIGYGSDSDRQESMTRSGIHTRNLQITDEAGQIRQTGLTAEETRAQVYTGTTTESAQADAGSLHNRFDKERVENEINLQRNVSQNFGHNVQQANGEINRHLDHLKAQLQQGKISQAEYDRQITLWQRGQVLLNSIASGLSAPTQSSAGIAANAVSPAVSYQIGQYFKELAANNRDGQLSAGQETAHILAHTVWGAAVAHAGGNNALAGALAAGGPEAAAPIISHYLYQERDGSRLSAEQKETVTAITGLFGTAAGAALGNTPADAAQGSLNAKNAVENNNSTRPRRTGRNPLWTEAQIRQHELNGARINALISQIRRIEPRFKDLAFARDLNRPIPNEEVLQYELYLNRIRPINSIILRQNFAMPSPLMGRQNLRELENGLIRDINLDKLAQAFNARPRVNGNLDARNINLQIGSRTIRPNPSASRNGMPIYSNMSEKEIFSVYQQYTGSQPSFRNIPNKGLLATTTIRSGNWQGTTIILRNFSTSQSQTGAKWTIEFQNYPNSIRGTAMELKFK